MSNNRNAFYIGDEWVKPSSDSIFDIIDASTGEKIASVPEAQKQDIDIAIAAARRAFDQGPWANSTAAERAEVMTSFMTEIANRSDSLAQAVSRQNGMPIAISSALEGEFALGVLAYYAEVASQLNFEDEKRPSQMGKETLVSANPVGVVAAIVPWNFPVTLAMSKIAPAMVAGCTLVIKPSPGTVLDSYILADAAQAAGVPPGVLNWVAADRDVGSYLVSHPNVDKVAFTGSTVAGRQIASTCGSLLRPATLELGGKSAAIILDDAEISDFVEAIPMTCMLNNGQACYNGTRILAPKSRYGEVVDAVAALANHLQVGNALELETHVGPMASAAHRDRVESYINKGKQEARLVAGGGRPAGLSQGWYVEPTVFADVQNDAVIAREEIFGPVLSIIEYENDAQAIAIANDSEFGLGGSVWSSDGQRAIEMARKINSGTVGVNGYMPSLGSPFGGVKASGLGREFGPEAIGSYQQQKSIYVM